jgi:uncharacterized membrane protein
MTLSAKVSQLSLFDRASVALLAFAAAGSVLVFSRLPDRVPSHLDFHGHVDGTLPRAIGAFLQPAVAALVFLLVRAHARRKAGDEGARRAMESTLFLTTILLVSLHGLLLTRALVPTLDLGRAVGVVLSVFWGGCALLFPRLRRNGMVGIRTPWTLASDENWARTHRFGGQIGFVAAIVALGASLAGATALALGAVSLSGLLPAVYSYWIAERPA